MEGKPVSALLLHTSIPARVVTVTADRDRYRIITGWHFQCYGCNFSTTFPPDDAGHDDAVQFRVDHKCFSRHDPNRRITIERTSKLHSASEGPGRA